MTATTGSVIPAAKAAVMALLEQATWPAQRSSYDGGAPRPQIAYGPVKDVEHDRIVVGDTAGGESDQEWLTFRPSRREVFELAVAISCTTPGLSPQEAVERAFGLFDVFAAAIFAAALTKPPLGVVGVIGVAVLQPRHTETGGDEGYSVTIDTAVRVEAEVAPAALGAEVAIVAVLPAKIAVGSLYAASANEIEVGTEVEAVEANTFGLAPYKGFVGGLVTVMFTVTGFQDYSTLLPDSSAERLRATTGTSVACSCVPQGDADGNVAHLTVGLIARTARFKATVGQIPAMEIDIQPRGVPLLEGFLSSNATTDRTATYTGANAQLGALSATQKVYANIHVLDTTGSGGTPSITPRIESDNAGGFGTPATVVTGSAMTPTVGTGAWQHISAAGPITDDFFRLQFTISGTTPHLKILGVIGVGKLTA